MSTGTLVRDVRRPVVGTGAGWIRLALLSRGAAPVTALTVLAAVIRVWRIGHQGFWFDEANTALLVHFSPGKMLGLIPKTESTPPLYYCAAWVWAHVFGYSEAPLRSLSAVVGVALVPVAFGVGLKLVSRRAGLILAALTACNPLLIWYSQEARSYEMLAFFAGASLLCFAHARERTAPRILAAWVVCSALALATHYYALLTVVPEALWLLAVHRRRRPVRIAFGIVALCGLALIPLALGQNANGRVNWIRTVALSRRLGELVPQSLVGFGSPAYAVLEPVAVAVVVLALGLAALRSNQEERRGALLGGGIALAGLALNLLLIAAGVDDLISRNVLALWLPAAVLVAGGLGAARARRVGLIAALGLCAVGLTAAVGVSLDRNLERPDWRAVARTLGPRPQSGTARAVFIQHYRDLLPLSLYLPRLTAMSRQGATVSELDIVSFTDPPSAGFCWWGSACNLWPSHIQDRYPIPGFHEVWRRHALQFTILRLVADRPVRLTPRAVGRVLRRTRLRNDELLWQRY